VPAWPLSLFTARPQERRQRIALKENRPSTVDGLKPLAAPSADGVWVHPEEARDLIDRIRSMNLDEPVVRMARAHLQPSLEADALLGASEVDFWGSPIRVIAHSSRSAGE